MAFTPTDLPDPVVPATNRWGIFAKSATIDAPEMSLPSASVNTDEASWNAAERMTSCNCTISRCSLGISMPTKDLPGITSTMRTLITAKERAKSFARALIFCTLTPAAGCTSNRVTTGPGSTDTTSASTPKSASFNSSCLDMAARTSAEKPKPRSFAWASSRSMSGSSPTPLLSKRRFWLTLVTGCCSLAFGIISISGLVSCC